MPFAAWIQEASRLRPSVVLVTCVISGLAGGCSIGVRLPKEGIFKYAASVALK